MKYNKVPLSSAVVTGGLKLLEQSYTLFYLPSEDDLTSKVELAIILKDGGVQREYMSLRFENVPQLRSLINNLIKAYVFYGKMEGLINPNNFHYKMLEIKKFVEECFRSNTEELKNYRR